MQTAKQRRQSAQKVSTDSEHSEHRRQDSVTGSTEIQDRGISRTVEFKTRLSRGTAPSCCFRARSVRTVAFNCAQYTTQLQHRPERILTELVCDLVRADLLLIARPRGSAGCSCFLQTGSNGLSGRWSEGRPIADQIQAVLSGLPTIFCLLTSCSLKRDFFRGLKGTCDFQLCSAHSASVWAVWPWPSRAFSSRDRPCENKLQQPSRRLKAAGERWPAAVGDDGLDSAADPDLSEAEDCWRLKAWTADCISVPRYYILQHVYCHTRGWLRHRLAHCALEPLIDQHPWM